jgi:hypothetical protein
LTDLIKFNNNIYIKKNLAVNCRGPGKNVVGDLLHVKPRKVKWSYSSVFSKQNNWIFLTSIWSSVFLVLENGLFNFSSICSWTNRLVYNQISILEIRFSSTCNTSRDLLLSSFLDYCWKNRSILVIMMYVNNVITESAE